MPEPTSVPKAPRQLGDVIPAPAQVRPIAAAAFTISFGTAISASPGAEHLARLLRATTGLPLPIHDSAAGLNTAGLNTAGLNTADLNTADLNTADLNTAEISIRIDATSDLGDEGYALTVTPTGINIVAANPAGAFWAAQTLAQLAAPHTDSSVTERDSSGTGRDSSGTDHPAGVTIPGGEIVDRPRFPYRGVMLDVARHFWTVDEVKAYIDAVVQFKINHLHLHLTDDQGWRLEIESRPLLTLISGGYGTGVDGVGPGYYTQADYTELVEYAADRFVTIVPEIDMPGHVNAAQAAYGELTEKGSPVGPRTDQEVGYSSLVAGLEETYAFVEDVIREVAALTPGPYLHIGGDEAQATSADDYRTFMTRALPLVAKYGKRVIGWHEMAAVDLPESAVPQFWRIEASDDGTARAAANGNKVIMSPADRTYLDMKYTADSPLGLDWAALIEVSQSYDWDPATRLPGVGEESLLGVEAALWSETLRTFDDVLTMTFPRLPAIAEIAWSPRETHDWVALRSRLAAYAPRWTSEGIAFHRSPEIDWR